MSAILQDVIVAAVAIGAAFFVARRLIDAVRPAQATQGCDHCALSGDGSPVVENSRTTTSTEVRPV